MLCPAALRSLLGQANSGGAGSTLLISREGSVLAHAGSASDRAAIVGAAVASNVWGSYDKAGKAAGLSPLLAPNSQQGQQQKAKETSLKYVLLDCAGGRAAVALVPGTDLIVCIFTEAGTCELGLLKKKVLALTEYLEEPLKSLKHQSTNNAIDISLQQ